MKRRVLTSALVIALSASLAGCSTISSTWNSWFGDDKNKPAALETLSGPATGRIVWSSKGDNINFPLSIATAGDRFVVAGTDGTYSANFGRSGIVAGKFEDTYSFTLPQYLLGSATLSTSAVKVGGKD